MQSLQSECEALRHQNRHLSNTLVKLGRDLNLKAHSLQQLAETYQIEDIQDDDGPWSIGESPNPFPVELRSRRRTHCREGPAPNFTSGLTNLFLKRRHEEADATMKSFDGSTKNQLPGFLHDVLRSAGESIGDPSPAVPSMGRPSTACFEILEHECLVRRIMLKEYHKPPEQRQNVEILVAKMLRSLASTPKWELFKQFCNETSGWDKIGLVTLWRIEPTPQNYYKLPVCYQPTDLQLSRPHWPMIDWWPFPKMRDHVLRNLELYDLTELAADMNVNFCFEMDLEDLPNKAGASTTNADVHGGGPRSSTHCSNSSRSRTSRNSQQYTNQNDHHDHHEQQQLLRSQTGPGTNQGETLAGEFVRNGRLSESATGDTKQVWVRLIEYVQHRKDPSVASSQGRVLNKSIIARLMLACQEFETPFKMHPGLFQKYPGLYADDHVVKGQEVSIFL